MNEISHKAGAFVWETKGRIPLQPYRELTFTSDGKKDVPVEIISLGSVVLVAGKPEINAITERQLQERSHYRNTLMKYMPDLESYHRISWESQASMLMPGAAEAFVDKAIKLMEEN